MLIPGLVCNEFVIGPTLFCFGLFVPLRLVLGAVISCILTFSVVVPLKRRTERDRPRVGATGPRMLDVRSTQHNYSFPSGDSAQVSVFACDMC
jgi:hypothetical protein